MVRNLVTRQKAGSLGNDIKAPETGELGMPKSKPKLRSPKAVLDDWWNFKRIIHWELPPANFSVTVEIYGKQMDRGS